VGEKGSSPLSALRSLPDQRIGPPPSQTAYSGDHREPRAQSPEPEERSDLLTVIEPPRGWTAIRWSELWLYRELLYFLTWRDVKIRYKQTVLGAAWAILQPFMTMVVFSLIFGRLAGLGAKTGGVPYPIYVYAGLLPWTFFANAIGSSANSLVGSANLVTKVYFPRLIIPLAAAGAGLMDLAVSFAVLLGLMLYYGIAPSWLLLLVPLFLIGILLTATGVAAILSALTVAYRDFQYVVPFLVQLWLFITPVIYPPTIIPAQWRWLLALNPMAGLIDGFRAAILARPLDWPHIAVSVAVSALLFLAGAAYFHRVERRFADII
jgi:lipopolysaccharide transport system permease protein